ncbi:MAG TPA: hypothetical protein DCG75_06180 [Bacteroidales bacterium]|jgi:ketosteroid isomerase-like protein|nr:hypothetical protein [Bacteroidales bacterium]
MKNLIRILILIGVFYSCQDKTELKFIDRTSEEAIVEETIKNSISWAKDKDTSLLYSIIANDENYLEVHPEKTVVKGITEFKKAERFWLDPRFKAVKCEVWDLRITLSQDATVAWFYCMLNDMNEWDGQPANWENTRWTGVLEKRNGKWRMVQMHFSYPSQ